MSPHLSSGLLALGGEGRQSGEALSLVLSLLILPAGPQRLVPEWMQTSLAPL